jgi:peroxiredoxin Q/BCP
MPAREKVRPVEEGEREMLRSIGVGERAPGFELEVAPGKKVSLSDFLGKTNLVLFFYPKDDTAGCTVEVCRFRDAYPDFVAAGADVVGISCDPLEARGRFAERHQLPFRLLSDPRGEVTARYGVHKALGLLPGRVTFVIDHEGVIRHVTDSRFRFKQHVTDSLSAIRALEASAQATTRRA